MESIKARYDKMLDALRSALRTNLGSIPFVNHGGCGVVAHALCVELAKINIYSEIINVAPYKDYHKGGLKISEMKEYINDCLKNNDSNSPSEILSSYHYVVYIPCLDLYLDSNGIHSPLFPDPVWHNEHTIRLGCGTRVYMLGDYTADEMNYVNQFPRQWNNTFDRRKIPTVYKRAKKTIAILKSFLPYEPNTVQSSGVQRYWNGNIKKPSFVARRPRTSPLRPRQSLSYCPKLREEV